MAAGSPPTAVDLETLIAQGARFVRALRPIWREVTRGLPRGRGRQYFALAVGLVAAVVAGTYVLGNVRHRDEQAVTPRRE